MFIAGLLNPLLTFVSFYLFLLRSWVGEDAFIFFRYVDNFINGHGLVFNIGERVEGFTSPLWVFLLSLTKIIFQSELRPTTILLGLFLSTTAIAVLLISRRSSHQVYFPIGVILLVTNSAFRDFATSGFETSLSYLLVSILCVYVLKNGLFYKPAILSLILALLVLNRPETVLLLIYVFINYVLKFWKSERATIFKFIYPAGIILGAYQVFRMGYYASVFPNTFYAKKGGELYIKQGAYYLLDFLQSYPTSFGILVILIIAMVIVVIKKHRPFSEMQNSAHLLGMSALLSGYVLYAGGDYMHGRFLLIPFILCAVSLGDFAEELLESLSQKIKFSPLIFSVLLLIVLLLVGLLSYKQKPITVKYQKTLFNIKDERSHFNYNFNPEKFKEYISIPVTNEFNWAKRGLYYRDISEALDMPISVVMPNIGFFGYTAGDSINVMGSVLTDPYLARFPIETRGKIGHENLPHNEYQFTRKPTFAYTTFKIWNESMHARFDQSVFSFVITGDDNDSFMPVFDLSNKEFIDLYSAVTGITIRLNVDKAVLNFLQTEIDLKLLAEDPTETTEFMGFLKLYWYPYTSPENQKLFDKVREEKLGSRLLSSYEFFNYYLKDYSDQMGENTTGELNVGKFSKNVLYALTSEFVKINSLTPKVAKPTEDLKNNPIKIDTKQINFANKKYILKIKYAAKTQDGALTVSYTDTADKIQSELYTHDPNKFGLVKVPRVIYLDITDIIKRTEQILVTVNNSSGIIFDSIEIY